MLNKLYYPDRNSSRLNLEINLSEYQIEGERYVRVLASEKLSDKLVKATYEHNDFGKKMVDKLQEEFDYDKVKNDAYSELSKRILNELIKGLKTDDERKNNNGKGEE